MRALVVLALAANVALGAVNTYGPRILTKNGSVANSANYRWLHVCDTEAELPASGQTGDIAFTDDSNKWWTWADGGWIQSAGGGSGAPTDAQYLVLASNATLTLERVLTAGTGISFTDGGAGGALTVSQTSKPVTAVALFGATNTLTNMALADAELPATQYRVKLDTSTFTEYRATLRVATVGAAASDLRFQGSTDDSAFGNLDGSAGPELTIATLGSRDTGWVTLASAYRNVNTYVRMMGKDGDGAADPVIRTVFLYFR